MKTRSATAAWEVKTPDRTCGAASDWTRRVERIAIDRSRRKDGLRGADGTCRSCPGIVQGHWEQPSCDLWFLPGEDPFPIVLHADDRPAALWGFIQAAVELAEG